MATDDNGLGFLAGGGEMGARVRAKDWSGTSLGPIETWPQSLRTATSIVLNARHPMIVWWGPQLASIFNDGYMPMLGTKLDGALGQPFAQMWPEIWSDLEPLIKTALAGGSTWSEDLPLKTYRKGYEEIAYFTFSYSPVHDESGRVAGILNVCTETTEKVLAEAARRKAEEELHLPLVTERNRLRELFEQAPVFLAVMRGPDHVFELYNAAFMQVVGHRDIMGKAVRDALPEIEGQGLIELLDGVYATGEPYVGRGLRVAFQRTPNAVAEPRFVDFVYQPIRDLGGAISGVLVAGSDVTEAHLSADALRAAHDRTVEILEGISEAFYAVDHEWRFTYVNRHAEQQWGKRREDLLGKVFMHEFPEVIGSESFKAQQTAMRERLPIRLETISAVLHHWVEVNIHPTATGGISVYFRDISARKRIEEDLKQLTEALELRVRERTAELERAHEALRQAQKMEALGQLTGGIAHDFNNLLQGIIGSLNLLQRRWASGRFDDTERFMNGAVASANRAAALTHRLLAFSRRQALDPHPADLNTLIESVTDLFRRTVGESIEIQLACGESLWPTLIDTHQLESTLLNLVINARDAMPNGGLLRIETRNETIDAARAATLRDGIQAGDYVTVIVSDTGIGMSPDVMRQVFDPFFTTKPIGQGTGLGMSMVYGFVKQSNGHIRLESAVGRGTTVTVYLPRYHGAVVEDDPPPVAELQTKAQAGQTVLVVEDEAVVRYLVVSALKELGYHVVESTDGPSALQILRSAQRIDLLVTDVGLPGLNGRQIADAGREHRPGLKVLLMTGYAQNAVDRNGVLEPGMSLLNKPFTLETLTRRIHDLLTGH